VKIQMLDLAIFHIDLVPMRIFDQNIMIYIIQ